MSVLNYVVTVFLRRRSRCAMPLESSAGEANQDLLNLSCIARRSLLEK